MLLSEFSLYTAEPLNVDDFSLLIDAVHVIAKKQQPNVHLLLSSMPVLTEDKQILNMSLYVQCGSEPKVEVFCKGRAARIDAQYKNMPNFMQQNTSYSDEPNMNISQYVAPKKRAAISSNTVFTVQTAGGAEYTQAIDICFDHACQHAKTLIKKLANNDLSENAALIPNQIDHILTSNTTPIEITAKVSESIVHIDPDEDIATPMENDVVTPDDFNNSRESKYPNMYIKKMIKGFLVGNPPFGESYQLVSQQERKLSGFSSDLIPLIEQRNNAIKKATIESLLKQAPQGSEFVLMERTNQATTATLNNLYQFIYNQCELGFLEHLFNTQSYQRKCKAKHITVQSVNILKQLQANPVRFMHHVGVVLNDFKIQLQYLDHGIPHRFSRNIIAKIDEALTHISQNKLRP